MSSRLFLLVVLIAASAWAQSAREYYKELYVAGGLDRMADRYVCFDDDPNIKTFFVFAESKYVHEYMMADGTFGKLPKSYQTELKKDFVISRGYDKGVALSAEDFLDADHDSWVSQKFRLDNRTPARVRFTIVFQTLRYKRAVEILNADGTFRSEVARYGRCELVAPGVLQQGR
jgi:hypothetical protein